MVTLRSGHQLAAGFYSVSHRYSAHQHAAPTVQTRSIDSKDPSSTDAPKPISTEATASSSAGITDLYQSRLQQCLRCTCNALHSIYLLKGEHMPGKRKYSAQQQR